MLGVSPLSITYSFAEIDGNEKSREFGAILTEKMVDGKLIVSHHAISDELSKEERENCHLMAKHHRHMSIIVHIIQGLLSLMGKCLKL